MSEQDGDGIGIPWDVPVTYIFTLLFVTLGLMCNF